MELLRAALEWVSERAHLTPTDWALGIDARIRALLTGGKAAENCYLESIERLGRTRLCAELARSHLLYGLASAVGRLPSPHSGANGQARPQAGTVAVHDS
jgi:hypothetical protein